jgi:hypothetical protein
LLGILLALPIIVPIAWVLTSFLFFLVLRRERLAWVATWLLLGVVFGVPVLVPNPAGDALMRFEVALVIGLWAFALARFGLLAFAGVLLCNAVAALAPLTADLSAWHAYQGVLLALAVVGLAVYAFFIATRGQRLVREGFFGDEKRSCARRSHRRMLRRSRSFVNLGKVGSYPASPV